MTSIDSYRVDTIATLGLIGSAEIDAMYILSPFVWHDGTRHQALLRLVNRASDPNDKISRIHHATSDDGVSFTIESAPAIAPSAGTPDAGGCEDPTVVRHNGSLYAFYSGWNDGDKRGTLLFARASHGSAFHKVGVALAPSARYKNPKEATLVRTPSGDWALFFEFARDEKSHIGLARSQSLAGPWTIDDAFEFPQRPTAWDSWHLSPGPIVMLDSDTPIMIYNGGNKDGVWRFGWAAFDRAYERIVDRSDAPTISPAKPEGDEADIAFVASAVSDGDSIDIYYSVADKTCKRARLART